MCRARRLRLLPERRLACPACASQGARRHTRSSNEGRAGSQAMKRKAFEQLVQEALATIPPHFREAMSNLAIVVEDEPSADLLEEMEIEPPDTMLGLYQGVPL